MTGVQLWWNRQSDGMKIAVGVAGGLLLVLTGVGLAAAVAEGGMIVVGPTVIVAVGEAAKVLARRIG